MSAQNMLNNQLLRQRRVRFLRNMDQAVAQRRQTNWGVDYGGYNAEAGAFVVLTPGGGVWHAQDIGGGAPGRIMRVSVNNQAYARTKPRGNR